MSVQIVFDILGLNEVIKGRSMNREKKSSEDGLQGTPTLRGWKKEEGAIKEMQIAAKPGECVCGILDVKGKKMEEVIVSQTVSVSKMRTESRVLEFTEELDSAVLGTRDWSEFEKEREGMKWKWKTLSRSLSSPAPFFLNLFYLQTFS